MGHKVSETGYGQEGGHQRRRDVAGPHRFSTKEVDQEGIEEHIAEKGVAAQDLFDRRRRFRRPRLLLRQPGEQQLRHNGSILLGVVRPAGLEEERLAQEPYHTHG